MSPRLLAVALVAACTGADSGVDSEEAGPGPRVLLPAAAWQPVEGGDHPFGPGPEGEECPPTAYGAESGFFEVETDRCAWAIFSQPLASAAQAGEPIEFVAWHLDLWAQVEAEARVVLQIGDEVLWDETFAIPGPEGIEKFEQALTADHPAGEAAWWHIGNHGYNSWRLGDVEVVAPE